MIQEIVMNNYDDLKSKLSEQSHQPNNRAEQTLHLLESELKNLIADKRSLKERFQAKIRELQT